MQKKYLSKEDKLSFWAGKVEFCFLRLSPKQLRLCRMVRLKTIAKTSHSTCYLYKKTKNMQFLFKRTPKIPNCTLWASFCTVSEDLKVVRVGRKKKIIYFFSKVYSDVSQKYEGLNFFIMHLGRLLLVPTVIKTQSFTDIYVYVCIYCISTILNKILVFNSDIIFN